MTALKNQPINSKKVLNAKALKSTVMPINNPMSKARIEGNKTSINALLSLGVSIEFLAIFLIELNILNQSIIKKKVIFKGRYWNFWN